MQTDEQLYQEIQEREREQGQI